MRDFDFIIVGGGSAGCAAAARLIQHYGSNVLLLEKGPPKKSILAQVPAGTVKIWAGHTDYLGRFHSEPEPGLGGRRVSLEHGTVMGGSSTVNMMAYMRGSREDYGRWSDAVGGGWGWDDLLPYFRRQEGNQRFDDMVHGGDGPLKVSNPSYRTELSHLFVKAMQRAGHRYQTDLTDGALAGVGYSQCTMAHGRRCSAVEAFIDPIKDDPRIRIVTGATVRRVMIEDGCATGVEYERDGEVTQARAAGEVILAAGTYETPRLLMLSGVGDAAHLKAHGLIISRDLPGVGRNLQDHHYAILGATAPVGSGFFGEDRGVRMLVNGARYLLFRDGPASVSGSESMAFVALDPSDHEATVQLYCMAMMHPAVPRPLQGPGISLLINLLAPRARGQVRLASANPADAPSIRLDWLNDEHDRAMMVRAFRYARSILAQPPLADRGCEEVWPGGGAESDVELLDHIRRTLVSNHHPVGTCQMGRIGDADAVLDRDLRVIGIDRLRVFDASMMPVLIRAATNATVMAVAEKGVDLMMASWRQGATGTVGA